MAASTPFGKAFAEARKSGAKTFEFGGKKYTTQLKEEVSKPKAAAKPAAPKASGSLPDQVADITRGGPAKRNLVDDIAGITKGAQSDAKAARIGAQKVAVGKMTGEAVAKSKDVKLAKGGLAKKPMPKPMAKAKAKPSIKAGAGAYSCGGMVKKKK